MKSIYKYAYRYIYLLKQMNVKAALLETINDLSNSYKTLEKLKNIKIQEMAIASNKIAHILIDKSVEKKDININTLEKDINSFRDQLKIIKDNLKNCVIKLYELKEMNFREIEIYLRKNNNVLYLYSEPIDMLNIHAISVSKPFYVKFDTLKRKDIDKTINLKNLENSCPLKINDEFMVREMVLKKYKNDAYDKLNEY